MYIKYQGKDYGCTCRPRANEITYSRLPEDFPVPVSGEITLCAEDGFVMRTDTVEDYLRQTFSGGTLVLTNEPEPEPAPEPEEPEYPDGYDDYDKPVTWGELADAYTEGVNSIDE